jgi:hypothetical protein
MKNYWKQNLVMLGVPSLLIFFFLTGCGGGKSNDVKPNESAETITTSNRDLPGARFKIGDTVKVSNCGLSYPSNTLKFKELGFKNPSKDHPCKGVSSGVVFGVCEHENVKDKLLYAVRGYLGDELLIEESGIKRGGYQKKLPDDFLGLYDGVEPGYIMKDEFDQEITYNNKKITIPSAGYRFLIESDNSIKLQMTNLEDNSQDRYVGQYYILRENADSLEIECDMTDSSDKRYGVNRKIILSKTNKNGSCSPSNKKQSNFNIKKIQ